MSASLLISFILTLTGPTRRYNNFTRFNGQFILNYWLPIRFRFAANRRLFPQNHANILRWLFNRYYAAHERFPWTRCVARFSFFQHVHRRNNRKYLPTRTVSRSNRISIKLYNPATFFQLFHFDLIAFF